MSSSTPPPVGATLEPDVGELVSIAEALDDAVIAALDALARLDAVITAVGQPRAALEVRRYWKLPVAELWTDADVPAVELVSIAEALDDAVIAALDALARLDAVITAVGQPRAALEVRHDG